MKFLLDTHIWLWMQQDKDRIPSPVRRKLSRDSAILHLSAAWVMEIAIKLSVGKLRMDVPASDFVERLRNPQYLFRPSRPVEDDGDGGGVVNRVAPCRSTLALASVPTKSSHPWRRRDGRGLSSEQVHPLLAPSRWALGRDDQPASAG